MGYHTDLLKLAADVDSTESKMGAFAQDPADRLRAQRRFAKKAIGYLSDAEQEWETVASFKFEGLDTNVFGPDVLETIERNRGIAIEVMAHITSALKGAKTLMGE